jgi:hypothetical protein
MKIKKLVVFTSVLFAILISAYLAPANEKTNNNKLTGLNFPDVNNHKTFAAFKFAAMGDSRGIIHSVNENVLNLLLSDCQKREPNSAFMVFLGDMVMGSIEHNITEHELIKWKNIVQENYKLPVCPLAGNHETQSNKSQEEFKKLFANVPLNGPEDEKPLTYYFDYNGCRFIILDTCYHGDTYRVRHMDWLENVLKDSEKNAIKYTFVFSHTPAFPTVGNHLNSGMTNIDEIIKNNNSKFMRQTRDFWDLLVRYKVKAYVCGHEHIYTRQNIEGIWQIVSGGGGAPFHKTNPLHPKENSTEDEKEEFEKALPYYEHLGYPHGPNDVPQKGHDFFGIRTYQYCIFEVGEDAITVKTYGLENNKKTDEQLKLIDTFTISK